MSDGIAYHGRTLAVGMTRSGKSELINVQFSAMRCQRAIYDSKGEFAIEGVTPVGEVDAIDWRQRTIHFQPGEDARGDAQAFFSAAFARPGALVVAVHEWADTCEYNAHGAPPAVSRYLRMGGAKGKGVLGGSQRPVGIPVSARTEAGDFFIFVPRMASDDHATIAKELAQTPEQFAAYIEQLHAQLGDHAFAHYSRRTRELVACPPLPAHVRTRNIVGRTHDA